MRPVLTSLAVLLSTAGSALAQDPVAPESTPFTLQTDQPRTPEQEALRIDLADLSIKVIPEAKAIDAVAVLTFTATAPVAALVVELDTRFAVSAVSVDGRPAEWSNPEGRMTVALPRPLAAGETTTLRIAYAGSPREAPRAPWDGGFVWSTAPGGEPWIATAVQGEGCDLFWPCIDSPLAEPKRVDLHVTVPTGLSAPSNGRFVGSEDHGDGWTTWNWSAANPNTYAIALNVGPYTMLSADYRSRFGNTFPMQFWHLTSDDPAQAAALFAEFPQQMDFYEATVGPFPFGDEKMGVVETPHLGMEHQTINAYGNAYKLDGRGYDWLLQHELSHEWFGNQLTNVNADDMWLHEGLGSYMQPLYGRWLNGDRYMQTELAKMQQGLINRYPIVSGRPMREEEVYDGDKGPGNDIYSKGALIAHSLRMRIGDAAFQEAVTTLVYGRPDPKPGNFAPLYRSTPDFLRIVNAVTGQDYGWFFQGYLYNAALPVLNQTREGDRLNLSWTTGDGGVFPMPVELEVDGQVQTVPMTNGRGSLTVPAGAHVIVDPANKVLRRLDFVEAYRARPAR
ncbi:peptidase M1 [Brevundimonas sp. LM2]|uniref:M1 family metallopeptidase n=1 Tax=Brevundimonas sp. LM2 TaxID=1938605 RepID=UPI000983EBD6|nr:M1 family metallopeptidase [Brevundimonas sp. LM2]AQR62713.1 peptidase M1 [Brevundimonas sp. LM2]